MIASCKTCGGLFKTTTEDAYDPRGTECLSCYRERNESDEDYVDLDLSDEALANIEIYLKRMGRLLPSMELGFQRRDLHWYFWATYQGRTYDLDMGDTKTFEKKTVDLLMNVDVIQLVVDARTSFKRGK